MDKTNRMVYGSWWGHDYSSQQTKKKDSGQTRRPLESTRVSLESSGRGESNGVWLEAVALPW